MGGPEEATQMELETFTLDSTIFLTSNPNSAGFVVITLFSSCHHHVLFIATSIRDHFGVTFGEARLARQARQAPQA